MSCRKQAMHRPCLRRRGVYSWPPVQARIRLNRARSPGSAPPAASAATRRPERGGPRSRAKPDTRRRPPTRRRWQPPHYDKGFVLVSIARSRRGLPFRLKLNHVSQFKYTNTMAVDDTYTDHLGEVKEVQRRNDIQLTRDVFYFSGLRLRSPAGLQHPALHLERHPVGDRRRVRGLRVQQGVRAARRVLLAAERAQP